MRYLLILQLVLAVTALKAYASASTTPQLVQHSRTRSATVTSHSSTTTTLPPACTLNILKMPSFETDCTFRDTTSTSTSYTDCGGCILKTEALGLGLPCRTVTTVPGVTIETVTACKRVPRHSGYQKASTSGI
ncbi:hypothetical protein ACN47E_000206 [Coniothyrium glycines]